LGTAAARDGLGVDGSLLADTSMSSAQAREGTGFQTGHVFPVGASHIAMQEIEKETTNTPMFGGLVRPTAFFGWRGKVDLSR
jgi:hypothetical protein